MVQATSQQQVTPDFIPANDTPDFIPDSGGLSPGTRQIVRDMAARPMTGMGADNSQFSPGRFVGQFGLSLGKKIVDPNFIQGGVGADHPDWNEYQWGALWQLMGDKPHPDTQLSGIPKFWAAITGQSKTIRNDFTPRNAEEQQQYNQVAASLGSDTSIRGKIAQGLSDYADSFQADPSKTSADTLASLLMLRQGFRMGKLPVLGETTPQAAEVVQPLSGYTRTVPAKAAAPAPPQTEYSLPNATYLRPDVRSLSQQPPTPTLSPIDRANQLLHGIREHDFLTKVQDELNRQDGQPEIEAAINQRMADLARKPVGVSSTPKFAYRVRDAGETGLMPQGHAQATLDPAQARSYIEGRGATQNAPQELVKVDLRKLDPSEYEVVPGPSGASWVRFKSAVPEAFISKVGPPAPKQYMTEGSDLIKALQQMAQKSTSASAGND